MHEADGDQKGRPAFSRSRRSDGVNRAPQMPRCVRCPRSCRSLLPRSGAPFRATQGASGAGPCCRRARRSCPEGLARFGEMSSYFKRTRARVAAQAYDSRGERTCLPNPVLARADATLASMAEDWVSERYDDALAATCALFLSVKDDHGSRLRDVAIEFLRQSAAGLEETSSESGRRTFVCSFCARAAPHGRRGARPGVFICNGCIESFRTLAAQPAAAVALHLIVRFGRVPRFHCT
jgi:ribosomal protein L37AE/L43A